MVIAMTSACSNPSEQLQRICREQAHVEVLQPDLWQEWLQAAREIVAERSRRIGQASAITGFEAVLGFEHRYGPQLVPLRPQPTHRIRQEDVYLVKGDVTVARFIDFVVQTKAFGATVSRSCFDYDPSLYFGGNSAK